MTAKIKILVTGGAGYIGSKFSYDAISNGYEVIIVDNLSTGNTKLLPKKAIFYKSDISNEKKIHYILKKHKIKIVVHFAASTNVSESMLKPLKYYSNNTIATEKLIKICCENKIKKFIFSSTCAVYGDPVNNLVSENDKFSPKSHYAKSKLLAELILQNYSKKYEFGLVILRYFNVIGADMSLRTGCINNIGQLFKNLSENIVNKKFFIKIYGKDYDTPDKTCIRDFIDINDLTFYHLELIKKIKSKETLILNCGYRRGFSINEIVCLFEKTVNKKIKKIYLKRRTGDIEKIVCNNKKIKKLLFLKKQTDINISIKNSILWEKKWKDGLVKKI